MMFIFPHGISRANLIAIRVYQRRLFGDQFAGER